MHLSRYVYHVSEDFLDYEFFSRGPKGKVKKIVRFTEISTGVYNLAFGDLNEYSGEINDLIVTNNNDSKKILATVASVTHDFTLKNKQAWIIANGSARSRTRLYRIGISNHWKEISALFEVYGLRNNEWERFGFHRDYDAFLIRRK